MNPSSVVVPGRRTPRPGAGALLLAVLVLAAAPARAQMVLDRSILVFDADSAQRQDVEIVNSGEDVLYLDTEVLAVDAPGTEEEGRRSVEDPDEAGLLVTPARMVLPPGGRQLVRIVRLVAPGERDLIRRINVVPVTPPQEADANAVKVVVAYQLLVIVRPDDPAPDLSWQREGRRIEFANDGNSNVLLYNGRQCPAGGADTDCVDLNVARRLYAGNRWALDLPLDAPVEFTTTVGETNARQRFD